MTKPKMEKTGELKYFSDFAEEEAAILQLSDEQAGKLYKAKFKYFFHETEPDFADDNTLKILWAYAAAKLDRNKIGAYKKSVSNAYKAYKRDLPEGDPLLNIQAWFVWKKALYQKNLETLPSAYVYLTEEDL